MHFCILFTFDSAYFIRKETDLDGSLINYFKIVAGRKIHF